MDEIDHATEILSFVLDSLQVVSYKWLSRKFSITSNEAKRLLQAIVDQHSSSVDVIYAVSGWSKTKQQCYSVQLVPKSRLQEAKDMLDGHVSTHVYSIQPSAPRDPAELWSAEYVQSEELFKQPLEINNCLRDNRFSAISSLSINRKIVEGHTSDKTQPVAANVTSISHTLKPSNVKSEKQAGQSLSSGPQSLPKQDAQGNGLNDVRTAPNVSEPTTIAGSADTKKRTAGSGDGALANLWGRASTKPKPVPVDDPPIDALVKACDASLEESSDDDATEFARIRRGEVKNGGRRARRMVIDDDFSDEEHKDMDSENIISLSSPEVPKAKAKPSKSTAKQQEVLVAREKRSRTSPVREEKKPLPSKDISEPVKEDNVKVEKSAGAPETKKRKVLKTRIDERGREVTEVVWESDDAKVNNASKDADVNPASKSHAQVEPLKVPENRSSGAKTSTAQNISSKAGAAKASGKASGKESQGKISAFFKRKN